MRAFSDRARDHELREITGYGLTRANSAMLAGLAPVFARFGLRRLTYSALSVIASNPGLRQADLSEALAIEQANLVVIVTELEQAGLIRRERSAEDRRAYALQPTSKGRQLARLSRQAVADFDRAVTDVFSEDERALLRRMLARIEQQAQIQAAALPAEDGADDLQAQANGQNPSRKRRKQEPSDDPVPIPSP